MSVKGFVKLGGLLLVLNCSALAGQQFGIYGLQSFTNHRRVPSPAGIGAFIQKDLSWIVTFRFSLQKGFDSDDYVKTIRFGVPFSEPGDTIRDLWHQTSSMTAYDVTVLFRPVGYGSLNLFVGAALGIVTLDFRAIGHGSGYIMKDDSNFRMAVSGFLDVEIASPVTSPMVFHFTVRERIAPDNEAYPMDGIAYLSGSVSSAEISFAVGLIVH